MKQGIIFSLEGILADTSNRYVHQTDFCSCFSNNSNVYHQDDLIYQNYEYYKFFRSRGYKIYIFSTWNEEYLRKTIFWLHKNNIYPDVLEMRKNLDYNPAYKVKQDFVKRHFLDPEKEIKAVFENDNSITVMYKEFKLKVYDCVRTITFLNK